MIIYPDIGLRNGQCVTLRRGQMTEPVAYDHNPIEKAMQFAAEGAEWLNVVDLDAAGRRGRTNTEIILEMIKRVRVPIQVSGGIAKREDVDWWIAQGAECVVIGSAAVLSPSLIRDVCKRHPYRVLLSVDVSNWRVMVDGWTRPTEHTPLEFARMFDRLDLAGIIVTDIDYDIGSPEASFALITEMGQHLTTPVIASGVVKTLDDLSTLKYLETISGAIVGRALHEGRFTLAEALRLVWEAEPTSLWWRDTGTGGV